ncbi:MAG: type II toxin-antitoxin system VapC family toxin [Planctomycetota bacterium]
MCGRRERRGHYTPDDARAVRAILPEYPIEYVPAAVVRDAAFEMAIELGRSFYDCLYLALAVRLGCPVATAARRFCEAVAGGPLGEHIAWIEDL